MSRFATFRNLTLAALFLAAPALSRAQGKYTITDLGTLGGTQSYGYGINISGQIAGYAATKSNAASHAVRWTGTALTDLGTLGGGSSQGNAINAGGQVAGYAAEPDTGANHAVLWTGSIVTDLGTLGGSASYGYGINDSGQVAGFSYTARDSAYHAARWSGNTVTDLGTLGGSTSYGYAINNSGQVAGFSYTVGNAAIHAVLWTGTTPTDLGLSAGTGSEGYAINDSGQVAGYSYTAGGAARHPVLWTGTTAADLGSLGGKDGIGMGLNSAGVVVGYSLTANGTSDAFYTVGTTMIDLNTLLPPGSGWQLAQANAINDNGWITGQGTINGQIHAFLLKPVIASVSGYLALEGVASLNAVSPAAPLGTFRFSFRTPGTTTELFGVDVTLITTPHIIGGTYAIPNISVGTYDIAIKGTRNLRVVLRNQALTGIATLPDVTLPAGDANNDNVVDTADFNVLIGAFGGNASVPGSGYDPAADFNFDGAIDVSDFNLLASEYGNVGDL